MKYALLLVIGLVAGAPAGAAEVFRWVDDDGVVHFSDRAHEGAEEIDVKPAQGFTPPPVQRRVKKDDADADADGAVSYESLTISRPSKDETIWSALGEIQVVVDLSPELNPDHSVQLFLDGKVVGSSVGGNLTFNLSDVDRGTHALRAEVRDDSGKSLIASSPVTFTVQKTSTLYPKNPNNPINSPPVATPFGSAGGAG
jgi:hypothetical protein